MNKSNSLFDTVKLVMQNWMLIIQVCTENIERGNEVEFYTSCKEKAIASYEDVTKIYFKELASLKNIPAEIEVENGAFQQHEDNRRFGQDEEQYLLELENQF